jgi:hypothetical protein
MPLPLEPSVPARSGRPLVWAFGVGVAVLAFVAIGYFATAGARPYLFPPTREAEEAKVEPRVVEHLPLYAVADDIGFVTELARPDLFGEDPAVAYDPTLRIPPGAVSDRSTSKEFESLAKEFRALPPARQVEIVKLDQDLHAREPKERDRLFRALEAYAVWLERLPEAERHGVLAATTSGLRLSAIREYRDRQWRDTLPTALRGNPELVQQWREDESERHDRLTAARQQGEPFAANNAPWPFDTEAGQKDVIDFARAVFRTEPNDFRRPSRLSNDEMAEYRRTLQIAQRDGSWGWFGLTVYELARLHPSLPEPENSKHLVVDPGDLPDPYRREMMKKGLSGGFRFNPRVIGKWPEFALEIHDQPFTKSMTNPPALGPARVGDFKKSVQEFANKELFPKMTADEKIALEKLAGKWPEYPRLFLEYAKKYDLSVPGVTLPGSPKRWDATYGTRPLAPPK